MPSNAILNIFSTSSSNLRKPNSKLEVAHVEYDLVKQTSSINKNLLSVKYATEQQQAELVADFLDEKKSNNKLRLHQITDKIISAFKITNISKKKDLSVAAAPELEKQNSFLMKNQTTKKEKSKQQHHHNENEAVEQQNKSKATISSSLKYLDDQHRKQRAQDRAYIRERSNQIRHDIKKTSGKKIDTEELEEVIESIMKVETWLKNHPAFSCAEKKFEQ